MIAVPWLAISTSLLLLIFTSRSQAAETLARKIGLLYRPILTFTVIAAMGSSLFIEYNLANFSLFSFVEYWYYLTLITSGTSILAFFVIVSTPSSSLERFIAFRLRRPDRVGFVYRMMAYFGLVIGLAFISATLYKYISYVRAGRY